MPVSLVALNNKRTQVIKFMTVLVLIAAAIALTVCDAPQRSDNPPVVSVGAGDKEMNAAIEKAQGSLNGFVLRLAHPEKGDKWFLVKGRFTRGNEVEHIWIADVTYDGKAFNGVLADEPKMQGLRLKGAVFVPLSDITDWMYVSHDRLVGGFTTRVLYNRLSHKERKDADFTRPFRIE
jgi:uncharacterized protein YegJ (DUF2314 family)